jgi:hypothetical protein
MQYLCSMFKLFSVCEKAANKGSLETTNAVLGCGICSYKPFKDIAVRMPCLSQSFHPKNNSFLSQDFTALPEEVKNAACATVFAAIDWIRELLNAFVGQPESESQTHILIRLNQLLVLEAVLREFLPHITQFAVPGLVIPGSEFLSQKRQQKAKNKVGVFFLFFFLFFVFFLLLFLLLFINNKRFASS